MRQIGTILLLAGIFCLNAAGVNAIFNGDFRLGTAGFGIWRMLRPDTNPELTFLPLTAGKEGVQLDNPNGEYFQLISKEFYLPGGQQVSFQAEFEGPAGSRLGFTVLYIRPDNKYITHHRSITLTGRRQTVEIPFVTADHQLPYLLVVYPRGEIAPTGTFRFFSFRLGGGQPPPVSAALRADKVLYTLGSRQENCHIKAELANSTGVPQSGTLALEITDSTSGAVVAEEKTQLELVPGNTRREFLFPLKKYGAFTATVRWNGQTIPAVDAQFACIGEYRGPAVINPAETYCVGIDGSYLYQAFRGETRGGYTANGVTPEKRFQLLASMGCRLIRDWGGMYLTEWRNLEPAEGQFDFSDFDRCVDMMRRNGMEILSVFGRMYENREQPAKFRPDWLQPKLITIEKNPPGTNPKFTVKVPPMPIWRRYVEAFVKHAGKRISIYEIMNEPNLNMSPELYMEYMVPAAEVIRKAAPHAAILGICATGDMNGRLGEYVRACTELGALKHLDGVSFHPYDARELNSITPADVQIADLRKIVGNKPLYNTELYFLYDWPDVDDKYGQYMHAKAYHAAWRFLIDLGEGLKTGISINERSLWRDGLHPVYRMNYLTDLIPTDIFVAYNALARHFEGAECIRKLRPSQDVICYVYRKDNQPIAAIWNYTGKQGVRADLSAFQVMDLFGNPESAGDRQITESPFYLKPGQLSETEFLSRLESLALRVDHPSASRIGRLVGDRLYVTLHNTAEKMQAGELGVSGGGITAVRMVRFTLPGKSSLTIEIPVKRIKSDNKNTELMLFTNGTTFRMPLEVIVNQTLGKEFRMENANGTVELLKGKILVEMSVRDTTDAGPTARRPPWKTDSVELFFDPAPFLIPENHSQFHPAKPEAFRLFVTPRDRQKLSGMGAVDPATCKLEVTQDEAGYSFRLEIPVKKCRALGFCVKINDAQGESVRETVLGDIPGPPHRYCCNFGIVKIQAD